MIYKIHRHEQAYTDEVQAMVIEADNEFEARTIAARERQDELAMEWFGETFSSIEVIGTSIGATRPRVILKDVR